MKVLELELEPALELVPVLELVLAEGLEPVPELVLAQGLEPAWASGWAVQARYLELS
jgi:hypothetical protein